MCIALLYIHTQAKVLLTMMLSSIKALIKIQLLVNVPGKAANDDSNNQVAATKVGDLTLVQCSPCFCFHSKKKGWSLEGLCRFFSFLVELSSK